MAKVNGQFFVGSGLFKSFQIDVVLGVDFSLNLYVQIPNRPPEILYKNNMNFTEKEIEKKTPFCWGHDSSSRALA
jgi:hypothetical protein